MCPVCGTQSLMVRNDLYDDRYGFPGKHALLECPDCGHRFLATTFTASELRELYTEYYPRRNFQLKDFRPHVELHGIGAWLEGERSSAFRWVPRSVRVLDIGCGLGETLAYHKARGCEAEGIDADANLARVAEHFGLNARVGLFEAKDYLPESFDVVTLDQVIEHVTQPRVFMLDVATVLRPGGHVIFATPNSNGYGARLFGSRWINWHAPYHLQQFSKRSLATLARESGLRVVSIRTLTPSRWLFFQWLHLWTRPPVGSPSPFWDRDRSIGTIPKKPASLGRTLYRARVFQAITRSADFVGLGDNFLCVLEKPVIEPGSPVPRAR